MRSVILAVMLPFQALAQSGDTPSAADRYAAACKAEVGPLPAFSCADGVPVPILVNGQVPDAYVPQMTCDRPGLLSNDIGLSNPPSDGQCVPHSRILDLSTPEMQVSVMCRQKRIRAADSMDFDEIDVIAHNPGTGATCWFMARGEPVDGSRVPAPTDGLQGVWSPPEDVVADGCGSCHDNDPFMYSPFVGQVWGHVPTNPLGLYYHVDAGVGFADWPATQIAPRDSTCTGCHRIGVAETCNSLTRLMTGKTPPEGADPLALAWPLSHAMPPEHGLSPAAWSVTHAASADALLACCANPDMPQCNASQIPGARP
ncbi:MAG: hypothetical protein Q7J57_15140 [Gemmobacter sp.]|nr:hypothetical protein [Gemmobacter sp.]